MFRFEYPVMKDGKPVLDENRKQVTKGRMLDFMGFQFHHDRTTIRKSNIEAARRKANHISKQDKISWYNASVMLSYMGLFKHTDTYNYYIEYIKPKINVKKLKRIVSKHSCCGRKEDGQNNRRPLPLRRIGACTIRAVIRAYRQKRGRHPETGVVLVL